MKSEGYIIIQDWTLWLETVLWDLKWPWAFYYQRINRKAIAFPSSNPGAGEKGNSWGNLRRATGDKKVLALWKHPLVLLNSVSLSVEDTEVIYLNLVATVSRIDQNCQIQEHNFSCLYSKVCALESSFDFKTSNLEIHHIERGWRKNSGTHLACWQFSSSQFWYRA